MIGEGQKISRFNNELDFSIALVVLRNNWVIVPVLLLLGLTGSFLYLRYTKPVYESNTVIQRSSRDEGKKILELENLEQEDNLSQDVELLRSSFLLQKALRNLNLSISYYSEGQILTEEQYVLSAYHITLYELRDSTLVGSRINVTGNGENVNLTFNASGKRIDIPIVPGQRVENDYFVLDFKITDMDQFRISISENNLYFVFNNYSDLTERLKSDLIVYTLNPDAKTIFISFESNNSVLAQDVVRSVTNTFFEYDLEKKSASSASILRFIDSQLDTVFLQLKESEAAIQTYMDSSRVNDPELQTQRLVEQLNDLQSELLDLDLKYELMFDLEMQIEVSDRLEIYNIIPVVAGTEYEGLLVKELEALHDLLVVREDAAYRMTQRNDAIKKINSKIDVQNKNILRIIASIRDQLKLKRARISARVETLEGELYGIPAAKMQLSHLNRMFDSNEKYYSLLIEKKMQYSISKAGYTMDNMVLQGPTVAALISPSKNLVLIGTIVLSLLISFIYLLIKYLTYSEIQNAEELRGLMPKEVGFLGVIPSAKNESDHSALIIHKKPKSALAESCRHIRANLQFILDDSVSNVIAISSSISGEGKTFVALNLAGILTMSGKKVLVLDLDLRKPKVHLGFGVDNSQGMSNLLAPASKTDWKDCVRKADIPGLDFITAGPIPPNPSEMIMSGTLAKLIQEFKKDYDVVLIDNPPVGIVSDGVIVLKLADCPIYVFRAHYSKRLFAQRLVELVQTNKIGNLYVILNGIKLWKKGYGYAYGYGYGAYYDDETVKKPWWKFWLYGRK